MAKHGKREKSKHGKGHKTHRSHDVPAVIAPDERAPKIATKAGTFDLDDPKLPDWVDAGALGSGGYPYDDTLADHDYERELELLQIELVKLQHHVNDKGLRIVALFEGRDAAGKGGAIFAMRQYMNPRTARTVALPKPSSAEAGQWYFQRYVTHLPTAGEIVLFDRSWYNRAGVERVMKFCTDSEVASFLRHAPAFERMLTDAGIVLFKFWLDIGQLTQFKRFHERRHNPLKIWKLSPIDFAALVRFDAYTRARDEMLAATHKAATPWTVVLANDKRRARLAIVRHILSSIDYRGKDRRIVGKPNPKILNGPKLATH